MISMKLFLNSLFIITVLSQTFAFNHVSTLPNNTVKLRNPQSITMNSDMDRRHALQIPFKAISASTLGFLSLRKTAFAQTIDMDDAQPVDDLWTKHAGKFDENNLGDYVKTSTGLLYKDVVVGKGKVPDDGDAVTVNMVGYIFETGEKWCNTYKGIPSYHSVVRAGVRENQKYMKGLNEGVKSMKKGGKRILVIPAYLAYSYTTIFSDKNPEVVIIPGGANLVCYVEVVDFKKLT